MLVYIDNPNYLRVYRTNNDPDAPKRLPIGRILKSDYEFVGDKESELSSEEVADIGRVIQVSKDVEQFRLRAEAMSFPEIARRVTEFYADSTDDVERRLISTAVQRMARAIRKD